MEWYKCKKNKNSCHDEVPDVKDPIHNYMGYSDDDCMDNFTACQSSRMNMTLDSIRTLAWFPKGDQCPVLKKNVVAGDSSISIEMSAYPNPFTTHTTIEFNISTKMRISLEVIDFQGRILATPLDQRVFEPGQHALGLDFQTIRQPVFVRLRSGSLSHSLKLIPQD